MLTTGAQKDFHDADAYVDPIEFRDKDGSRTDRHASAKQSDARVIAEEVARYREQRGNLVSEFLSQQASEGAEAQDTAEQQQQDVATAAAQQQAEIDAARQRAAEAEQERLRAVAELNEARQGVYAQELGRAFQNEFPDIRSDADVIRLAQTDPARAARLQQLVAHHAAATQVVAARHAQQEQQWAQQQQWQRYCSSEDGIFERQHPELKDPKISYETQQEAIAYLEEQGVSRQEPRSFGPVIQPFAAPWRRMLCGPLCSIGWPSSGRSK